MGQSNLTRGLLLSTLVWTLSINCTLKVSAQAIKDLSSSTTKQEQAIKSDQDLLQTIDLLQAKAKKFRQTVDSLNLRLQEQFKSQRITNTVDFQQVLANWEQFNRIWHDFTGDLEANPEFSPLLEESKIFNNINQNLLLQKEIISNLAKVLNKSSTLVIVELQEQLFTTRELNRSYYPYGSFETKTQHKFALISTNKARELELQVSQIENLLSNYLLNKAQRNNNSSQVFEATTVNSPNLTNSEELVDHDHKQTAFLNDKIFIILTVLSGCGIFVIWLFYTESRLILLKQKLTQDRDSKISQENFEDYLQNIEKIENQAREILNSTNQVIENEKKNLRNQNKPQPKFNSPSSFVTPAFSQKTPEPVIEESSPTDTSVVAEKELSLVTEEDLIAIYRQAPQLLFPKIIKVDVNKESIQRKKAGLKSEIIFQKTSNDTYWIVTEPELANNCYFLVPNPNLEINSVPYSNLENVFNCKGYKHRTSNKFKLKLSAMVKVESANSWKLIGTGEITFS